MIYLIKQSYKMGKVKELNIKNRTYYYFDDIINIKDFHSKLLRIDKKQYKDIDIFTILATLLLKKLVIVKILTVLIHYI